MIRCVINAIDSDRQKQTIKIHPTQTLLAVIPFMNIYAFPQVHVTKPKMSTFYGKRDENFTFITRSV